MAGPLGRAENFYTGEQLPTPVQQQPPYVQPQQAQQYPGGYDRNAPPPAAPTPSQYSAQPARSDSWQQGTPRAGQQQYPPPQPYPGEAAPQQGPPQTPAAAPAPVPAAAPSAPPSAEPSTAYYYQQPSQPSPAQDANSPYPNLQQPLQQYHQQPVAQTPVQQPAQVQSPQMQQQQQQPPPPQPQGQAQQGYWQPAAVPQQPAVAPQQWAPQGQYAQEPQKAPQPVVEESLIEL